MADAETKMRKVQVANLPPADSGRGVARLPVKLMTEMGLAEGDVTAPEPFLLPVCALLLLAGTQARRSGAGSWIAYGPAVGLLGGAALLERLAGGPAWHALVAGGVGVAAVAAGGRWRLAAPLFLGTGILVTLVGYETLAVTAGLPTWVWLALGGSILLTFVLQLATSEKDGLVSRTMLALCGSLVLLALTTGVVALLR